MAKDTTKGKSKKGFIDLSKHENPNYNALLGTEGKVGGTIKVEKPDKEEWFKIHPDPKYSQDLYIAEARVAGSLKPKAYLVQGETEAIHQELLSSLDTVRYCCCHLYATSTHQFKVWPRKQHDGTTDEEMDYHSSSREASIDAKDHWIKMKWSGGQYNWRRARDQKAYNDVVWPAEQSMLDILEIAFQGRVITDTEHPVVMRADGRA